MESVYKDHTDRSYRAEKPAIARIFRGRKQEKNGNYNYLSNMDTPTGIVSSPLKIARSGIQVRTTDPASSHSSGVMNTSFKDGETVGNLAQTWNPVGTTNRLTPLLAG